MTISERTSARHRLARAVVLGSLLALPLGFAAPALSEPLTLSDPLTQSDHDNNWYSDCDHNGNWGWQQNRGRWQNGDCDNNRGHWEYRDRDNGWGWHRDYDDNWGGQNRGSYQQSPLWCQFGSC
ncbi:hypothetical protein ACWEOI_30305 [Nocardia sp. NPDC004340]